MFGVMLMFVGVMNFGQGQKIRFIIVKFFLSNSNQFLVFLIWLSELASYEKVLEKSKFFIRSSFFLIFCPSLRVFSFFLFV